MIRVLCADEIITVRLKSSFLLHEIGVALKRYKNISNEQKKTIIMNTALDKFGKYDEIG